MISCQNNGICNFNSTSKVYSCQCINNFYGSNCQYQPLNSTAFINSTILTQEKGNSLLNLIGVPLNSSMTKIYQATIDGFGASNFHSKVDGINGTLIVIKSSNGNIFGGFTSFNWGTLPPTYYNDTSSYIYSLINQQNYPFKSFQKSTSSGIYPSPTAGPIFGQGNDLYICNQSNSNPASYQNFGHSYPAPLGYAAGSTEARSILAGSYNFLTVEIEVYTSNYTFYYMSYLRM